MMKQAENTKKVVTHKLSKYKLVADIMPFNPEKYDLEFGNMLNIDDFLKKDK